MMIAMEKACLLIVVVCFTVISMVGAVIPDHGSDLIGGIRNMHNPSCQQVCAKHKIKDGCKRPTERPITEVIVMTEGSSSMQAWKWETITMVVATYARGTSTDGLTSCIAHSHGKRYGLREPVPGSDDIQNFLKNSDNLKKTFIQKITNYQKQLMADHMVFDLLLFFRQLELDSLPDQNSIAMTMMDGILTEAIKKIHENYDSEVYCIVPWEPPCPKLNCTLVKKLLSHCHILLLSPDSYMPLPDKNGQCRAQATVPISKFLYGLDRYMSLRMQPIAPRSIVAGIPWHGFTYKCHHFSGDACIVNSTSDGQCFDSSNRRRHSLTEIHNMNMPKDQVRMDVVTRGMYFTKNDTAQMWFENFTTLYIKYHLVQDLQLKGVSLWYGEDLAIDLSTSDTTFTLQSWNFMTHQVLHQIVRSPKRTPHFYAGTVAWIGIGCLLLGTVLGVAFTCIGFRRKEMHQLNRPFKLDEVEDEFRDDEGL